jgi:hypothetical protein
MVGWFLLVNVKFQPQVANSRFLNVIDNGSGIENMQDLLTVAKSGWDEKTVQDEHAFGMGFLSALFAAKQVTVESNGRTLDMDTEQILSMQDVAILPVSDYTKKGTSVTLYGLEKINFIERLITGFAIPVFYNGVELDRKMAIDSGKKFIETDVGMMYINFKKINESKYNSPNLVCYLQGFKVFENHEQNRSDEIIVHLDSRKFFGRMPDREKLFESEAAIKSVWASYQKELDKFILDELEKNGEIVASTEWGNLICHHSPLLLNQITTLIPREMFEKVSNVSMYDDDMHYTEHESYISRSEVESGVFLIFESDSFYEEEQSVEWQFKKSYEKAICLSKNLPENHWAQTFIHESNSGNFEVEAINPGKAGLFNGDYINTAVTLCDSVVLKYGVHTVTLLQDAAYSIIDGIFVPEGETLNGCIDIIKVISSYTNNDDFDSTSFNSDQSGIYSMVQRLRTQDFASAVTDSINSQNLSLLDGIEGKQFLVSFSNNPGNGYNSKNVKTIEIEKLFKKLGVVGVTSEAIQEAVNSLLDVTKEA